MTLEDEFRRWRKMIEPRTAVVINVEDDAERPEIRATSERMPLTKVIAHPDVPRGKVYLVDLKALWEIPGWDWGEA